MEKFTFSPFRKVMRDSSVFLLSVKSSMTRALSARVKQRTEETEDRSPVRSTGTCTSPSQVRVPNARVRVESESFSARVQVKSRVSKFSSRVGLESESRTRECLPSPSTCRHSSQTACWELEANDNHHTNVSQTTTRDSPERSVLAYQVYSLMLI